MITALMSDTIERVRQNYVFDAGLMAWVPMTQPGGGTGGTASNFGAGFPVQGTAVGFIEEGTGLMAGAVVTATGALKVDAAFSGGTVDQGAAGASPWLFALPTGASTSALQTTGNTSLATLAGIVTANRAAVNTPADPFGLNADAASATGSISAKLRFIAATGIPVTAVPADPFGANADAQSASGSISAKLRFLTTTGIIVTALPATPAGTNLIGKTAAGAATDALYNGTTALTPKFASISAASSGDNTIVSSPGAVKIRVLTYVIVADGTVTAQWQSSTAGNRSGAMALTTNTGVSAAYCPVGHFETASGEDLQLNLGGAVGVRGHLTYVEV